MQGRSHQQQDSILPTDALANGFFIWRIMEHHFNVEIANEYGMKIAIMVKNIDFWISKNAANKKNYHENRYWTYNSAESFIKLFPYMSVGQIRRTLDKMISIDILIADNFNKASYDRTRWFTFTDQFKAKHSTILQICAMDYAKMKDGFDESAQPIPYNKPYNKPDSHPPQPKVSPEHHTLASKLRDIVLLRRKRNITTKTLTTWANSFRLLMERDGRELEQIEQVMEWYKVNWRDTYTPVIESADSFRKKFDKVLDAMERNGVQVSNGKIDCQECDYLLRSACAGGKDNCESFQRRVM